MTEELQPFAIVGQDLHKSPFESPFILLLALWKSPFGFVEVILCSSKHFVASSHFALLYLCSFHLLPLARWTSHQASCPIPIGVGTRALCPTCELDQSFLLLTLEVSLLLERPLPLVDFPLAKKVSSGIPFRFPGRKLGTPFVSRHMTQHLSLFTPNDVLESLPLSSMMNDVLVSKPAAVDTSADVKQAQDSSASVPPVGCSAPQVRNAVCRLFYPQVCRLVTLIISQEALHHVSDSTWKVFSLMP